MPLGLMLLLAVLGDEPTTTLAGQVVDAMGAPAAGADVVLTGFPKSRKLPTVARGKTDAAGRFALERPANLAGEGPWRAVRLWASRPGDRLVHVAFPGPLPAAGEPVRLALPPRGAAEFRVEGPDGRAVAGARVRVRGVAPVFVAPPEELARRVEATTDADGLARIDAVSGAQVSYVEVEADGLGIQPRYFDPPLGGRKRLALRPAGSVEGRFVADDGRSLRGWKVSATTQANDEPGGRGGPAGRAEAVALAEDGSFRFPAIAAGSLDLWVDCPEGPDPDILPAWPRGMAVRAGRDNRVEIPVRPATLVEGVIRERGTGAPVPGVKLHMFRPGETAGANAETDAQGRFSFRSLPGKARAGINDVPPTHVRAPAAFRDEFEVPAPPGRVELPPVELARAAPPLRGVVRDAVGAPVAGAAIGGDWNFVVEGTSIASIMRGTTDAEGRFAIVGIAPDARVSLTAQKGDRATRAPVAARGGQDAEVVLTIEPQPTVSLAGRVVAWEGTPLAGAAVRFNARTRRPGQAGDWRQVSFDQGPWIYTGPDGTFHTPAEPRQEGAEYQAEAGADGYLLYQSPWTPAGEADVLRLPDLVLRRATGVRVVAGRVTDAAGASIAGARVLQRGDGPSPTEAATDADGRFRLPGVAGGRALICAEAPGFRPGGAIIEPEGPVAIRLARVGEAVRPLGKAPEPLTRARERELGVSLLEPLLGRARIAAGNMGAVHATLARLAPDRALAMLEERVTPNPAAALIQVALARFEDDPGAAPATLDADRSGSARSRGLLALADLADAIAPDRRAGLLDGALAEARRIPQAEPKLILMGEVADRWLESFDVDRAAPILREGQAILQAVRPELFGYNVASFGEALAAVDQPAAEAFLARRAPGGSNDEGTRMRDRGMLAIRAAASDPAAAERLAQGLKEVPNFYETSAYLLRVARNMARADLPRARAVLELLDNPKASANPGRGPFKPYGLALLAEARADTDPAGARALLDEAFAGLRAVAEARPGQPTYPPVSSVMAGLLPLVERLQPDRVAERLWLAVACRPGRPEPIEAGRVAELLVLASLVARFDREMAAMIVEPAAARLPELAGQEYGGGLFNRAGLGNPFQVLASYDPRVLADLIQRLPQSARVTKDDGNGWVAPSLEDQIRLAGAEMLGLPPEMRRRAALETPFGTWPVRGNGRFLRSWP
jgi:hypothetical protein